MDDPGMSLFQGAALNVGENENQEEAEDLEEQIRRREELQNLLINALDDFKYEDSTIHSSTNVSVASVECMEQAYRDVQTPYEQLKLLYDIRMKEIQALQEQLNGHKVESTKEIDSLKRKLTLQEAETSQLDISLRNTKSLLVEKIDVIAKKDMDIASKDAEISKLTETVEQLQYDVQAYKSAVDELQLKLTMDTGPFNVAARILNAEELHNKHREQVEKLDTMLQEHKKKIDILEKEKLELESDLKRIIENSNENEVLHNNTVTLLNENVESAQNQCRDLLNLVEMLSSENEHFRGRLQKIEAGDPISLSTSYRKKTLDHDTLISQNERLKKMLLDKDAEVGTLKSKVKFYDSDVKELIEYRDLRNRALFNTECNQPEHNEKFMIIQNQMRKLEDDLNMKNQEIHNLTLINKELEGKIENMIIQTRNDLENLSQKYKLPELETMSEELKNAEMKINELQLKLSQTEAEAEELKTKMKKNDINELKFHLDEERKKVSALQEVILSKQISNETDSSALQENKRLRAELEGQRKSLDEVQYKYEKITLEFDLLLAEYSQLSEQFKELDNDRNEDNILSDLFRFRADIESFWNLYKSSSVGKDYMEIKIASWINQINLNCLTLKKLVESEASLKKIETEMNINLKESEKEIQKLTEIIDEVNNSKTLLEGEKSSLEIELRELKTELNGKIMELDQLKTELEVFNKNDKNVTIQTLEDASHNLKEAKKDLIKYQDELLQKCKIIKKNEIEMKKLELEVETTKESLELSRKEVDRLVGTVTELTEKLATLEKKQNEDQSSSEDENFNKARLLRAEVCIRDELRKEYEYKIGKIEDTYRKIIEINQQKLNKYKDQENNYRCQLADILNKYAQIISPIQNENSQLKEHLAEIEVHYNEIKDYADKVGREHSITLEKIRTDAQKAIDAWKMWAKAFVQGCLSIEKLNAHSRNKILNTLKDFDYQVDAINNSHEENIRHYKKKYNLPKT